jgi:hypothetical protein
MVFRQCFFSFFVINFTLFFLKAQPDSCVLLKFAPYNESSLFLFTAGYKVPVNKSIILNSGYGLYFEGGINPGKYISKKIIIGLYVGWAWRDGLWSTSFNNNFASGFSSSINKEAGLSSLDSSVVSVSSGLFSNTKGRSVNMPGCEMNSFHNYSLYYGLMFKLPFKYSPVLKVYMGTTHSHYQGPGNIITKEKDYNIFQLRRAMYGCELIVFRGLQKSKSKSTGTLSVYFENCNFYNSSLYFTDGNQNTNIPLKKFISASFLQKYRNEVAWGFKLSLAVL